MAVRIPYMPLLSVHNNKPKFVKSLCIIDQNDYNTMIGKRSTSCAAKSDSQKGSSPPPIQIKSNIKLQKVFEDESSGVVCYKDEKGEIICEGYDEGPRLSRSSCHPRDGEAIIGLLKRSLLIVTEGAGSHG